MQLMTADYVITRYMIYAFIIRTIEPIDSMLLYLTFSMTQHNLQL